MNQIQPVPEPLTEEQLGVAINAGKNLFTRNDVVLPFSDGMYFLKQLIVRLDQGMYALLPMGLNAEGNPVPLHELQQANSEQMAERDD